MSDRNSVVDGLDEISHYDGEQLFYNDVFIRGIAEDALVLLKEQGEEIEKLKEIIKKADYTLVIVKDKLNDLLKKTEGR